jgi:hypothetical protein
MKLRERFELIGQQVHGPSFRVEKDSALDILLRAIEDGVVRHGFDRATGHVVCAGLRQNHLPMQEGVVDVDADPDELKKYPITCERCLDFIKRRVRVQPWEPDHSSHGDAFEDGSPIDADCPCRGTAQQGFCAEQGCGFCTAAELDDHGELNG